MAKGFRPNFIFIVLLFVIIIGLGVFHHWLMKSTKPCLACEGLLVPTVSEDGQRTGEYSVMQEPTPTPHHREHHHHQEPAPVTFGAEFQSTPAPLSSSMYGQPPIAMSRMMPTPSPTNPPVTPQEIQEPKVYMTPSPAKTVASMFGDFSRYVSGVWKRQ